MNNINENKIGYSYPEISLVPAEISDIKSRSECNVYLDNGKLPLFASPMSTITNIDNYPIWEENGITPIMPRNIMLSRRWHVAENENQWIALSLKEFTSIFVDYEHDVLVHRNVHFYPKKDIEYKICVDLANGHMKSLYETINTAKELARKNGYTLIVMTGNIANPDTYQWICKNAEVDYIRVSIGTGANCLTSTQTAIHYPIATLIDECYQYKKSIHYNSKNEFVHDSDEEKVKSCPKIVADGGVRGYADIIKALALGADYVMVGSLFTSLLESAADLIIETYNSHYKYSCVNGGVNDGIENILNIWCHTTDICQYNEAEFEKRKRQFIKDMKSITKESYGMSTKKAQQLINPNVKATKTSEGCTKYVQVKETVFQWTDNFKDYLKSAMSYCGIREIKQFVGKPKVMINSPGVILRINQ